MMTLYVEECRGKNCSELNERITRKKTYPKNQSQFQFHHFRTKLKEQVVMQTYRPQILMSLLMSMIRHS